jgi:hypothetical protein
MGKLRSAHGTFGPTGQMSSIEQHFRGGSRRWQRGYCLTPERLFVTLLPFTG